MTKDSLEHLEQIQHREETGNGYLKIAKDQNTVCGRINCLLGNLSNMIREGTLEDCWELMKHDVECELERLRKEFEEA